MFFQKSKKIAISAVELHIVQFSDGSYDVMDNSAVSAEWVYCNTYPEIVETFQVNSGEYLLALQNADGEVYGAVISEKALCWEIPYYNDHGVKVLAMART